MCSNNCAYTSYEDEFKGGEPSLKIPGTEIKVNSRFQLYLSLASVIVAILAFIRK